MNRRRPRLQPTRAPLYQPSPGSGSARTDTDGRSRRVDTHNRARLHTNSPDSAARFDDVELRGSTNKSYLPAPSSGRDDCQQPCRQLLEAASLRAKLRCTRTEADQLSLNIFFSLTLEATSELATYRPMACAEWNPVGRRHPTSVRSSNRMGSRRCTRNVPHERFRRYRYSGISCRIPRLRRVVGCAPLTG